MHLCLTEECISSSLQFLQHCLPVFLSIQSNQLIRSQPPPPPLAAAPPSFPTALASGCTQTAFVGPPLASNCNGPLMRKGTPTLCRSACLPPTPPQRRTPRQTACPGCVVAAHMRASLRCSVTGPGALRLMRQGVLRPLLILLDGPSLAWATMSSSGPARSVGGLSLGWGWMWCWIPVLGVWGVGSSGGG